MILGRRSLWRLDSARRGRQTGQCVSWRRLGTCPIQRDRIAAFVVGSGLESGTGGRVVRARVGTEMDVIDMKATGLLVVGGRVKMARPG